MKLMICSFYVTIYLSEMIVCNHGLSIIMTEHINLQNEEGHILSLSHHVVSCTI